MTDNTLDYLMSANPLKLTDPELDAIIAYQRKDRARADRGDKPEKLGQKAKKAPPTKTSIDLLALGLVKPKVVVSDRRD